MTKIATHSDADGISSAVLLVKALYLQRGEYEMVFPEEFGILQGDEDYCLDMRPENAEWKGLCIDHHPDHPESREYMLISGEFPTSRIVYEKYKRDIPDEEKWKVVVGCVGDGQPESIPVEIFMQFPELLEEEVSAYKKGYELTVSPYPKYKLVSAPINGACRIGKPDIAFNILLDAKSVDDILYNEILNSFQRKVREEVNKAIESSSACKPKQIYPFVFWKISSETSIQGLLAIEMYEKTGLTTVVINEHLGRASIRGELSSLIVEALRNAGIKAGGHPGFAGFSCEDADKVLKVLRELRRKIL